MQCVLLPGWWLPWSKIWKRKDQVTDPLFRVSYSRGGGGTGIPRPPLLPLPPPPEIWKLWCTDVHMCLLGCGSLGTRVTLLFVCLHRNQLLMLPQMKGKSLTIWRATLSSETSCSVILPDQTSRWINIPVLATPSIEMLKRLIPFYCTSLKLIWCDTASSILPHR